MTRLTAEAAEASVDFDDDLLRVDRGALAFRGFDVPGVRLFRPRLVANFSPLASMGRASALLV